MLSIGPAASVAKAAAPVPAKVAVGFVENVYKRPLQTTHIASRPGDVTVQTDAEGNKEEALCFSVVGVVLSPYPPDQKRTHFYHNNPGNPKKYLSRQLKCTFPISKT